MNTQDTKQDKVVISPAMLAAIIAEAKLKQLRADNNNNTGKALSQAATDFFGA